MDLRGFLVFILLITILCLFGTIYVVLQTREIRKEVGTTRSGTSFSIPLPHFLTPHGGGLVPPPPPEVSTYGDGR